MLDCLVNLADVEAGLAGAVVDSAEQHEVFEPLGLTEPPSLLGAECAIAEGLGVHVVGDEEMLAGR